jgi:hypothetical protein
MRSWRACPTAAIWCGSAGIPERPVYAFRDLGVMGQPARPFVLDMRGIAPSKVVAGEPDRRSLRHGERLPPMSLDLFTSNADDAVNYAARVSAPELPSTFSDNFNDAWNKGYLTSQSISGEIRKTTARQQMVDDAIAKTGDQSFAQSGEGGGFDTAGFNAKVAQHKASRPDLDISRSVMRRCRPARMRSVSANWHPASLWPTASAPPAAQSDRSSARRLRRSPTRST